MVVKVFFYLSILMIFYIYLGYPILATLFGNIFRKKINQENGFQPEVTILISAFNEEKNIEATIINKLQQTYPKEKIEIITISDGSTDNTDNIVKKFENYRVKLIRQDPRAGKTAALNKGIRSATGEIIIFSDANSIYHPNALQRLIRNFADPQIGYVTGKMIYSNPDGTTIGDGCSAYMKYENFLRTQETNIGSIIGVDGGIDAVRKGLYEPMNPDQLPDFVLPLKMVEKGYRVVYEPEALLWEPSLKKAQDEYRMRVRVALRALWALWDMRQLLSFSKNKPFTWQLWSHKVLRYLCFIFLLSAYGANLLLWSEGGIYWSFFLIQTGGYIAAIGIYFMERKGFNIGIFYILSYFTLLNLASAHAFVKFILGQKLVVWTPRKG